MKKTILGILFCLAIFASEGRTQEQGQIVNQIDVVGSQRIDPETVLAYTPISVGDRVSVSDLNEALSSLFKTELFNDVSVTLEGDRMIITVDENPIVNRISIEGNDVLEDERLLEFIGIQPRRVYTRKLALEAKATLIEIYRQSGRYAATVEPKIIELPDKRVDLVFEVNEGPLVKISKIKFIGNEEFSDRVLKNVIESRESKWYIFLTQNDKYDSGRLQLDIQNLRQFYLQNGFAAIDVTRTSGELLADRSGFVLTYVIDEGERYSIASVNINSEIESVNPDDLTESSQIEIGQTYDIRVLEQSLLAITNRLGELGFAFVDVSPEIELNAEDLSLDININIGAAQRNYVEAINIKGNDRTLDRVIRRRFELVEGDSFNQLRLTRSERNVRNLGYFSDVELNILPGSSPEQSIVDLEVDETTTGSFSFGVGYSTFDDGSITIGINESNFLGTGRGARANVTFSSTTTSARAGITEPYLFERNLLGSADVFIDERKFSNVTIKQNGLDLGVAYSASGDYRHRIGYTLANTQTETSTTQGLSTSGDEGVLVLSEVSYSLTRDLRDNRIDPRDGYLWRLTESVAGLGGDIQYLRSQVRGQYLYPFYFNRVVIGVDGEAGLVDGLGENVNRSSRFLLGGRRVRGFGLNGIGPRDLGDNSAVGGNKFYLASANITSDLGIDQDLGVRWTLFTDYGTLWETDYPAGVQGAEDDSLRSSFGYGILWDTQLGPMSFLWAHAIDKRDYDTTRIFQFRFGGRF